MLKYPPYQSFVSAFFHERTVSTIKKVVFYIKDFFKRADMLLFALCFSCACFSVYAVYIATLGMQAGGVIISPTKNVIVQIFSIVVGVGAFVIFTVIDADILGAQWRWLCVINVALMVALVIFGSEGESGSRSWIRFAGISVQPSEIVKVFYIIVSAKQMTYLKEHKDINAFTSVVQIAAHFVIVFGMIVVVGDDLGSGTIILALFLLMFFAAGVKLYWFAIGGAAVAAVIPILWNYFLKDYQKQRLIAPYDKSIDPDGWGITWQTTQSRYSLMAGRMTGAEADHRATVFTGKHTDFIFASIGEHLGMIACIAVILILTVIIIRCVWVGLHAGRMYDMLICIGVAGALAFQTFINIGMCIGVTPVIGIPLPFFSYGGSSMVTLFAAVGLVSGVHYKPKPEHFSMIY